MSRKKVLFLTHSNNDIDWFLPLAVSLKENSKYVPQFFFLKTQSEVSLNRVHDAIIKEYDIACMYLFEDVKYGCLTRFLYRVCEYCAVKTAMVPFKKLAGEFRIFTALLKIGYILISKMFRAYPNLLLPPEKLYNFIEKIDVSMLICDIQIIKKQPPFSNVKSFISSCLVAYFKEKNIPIFMMPHGEPAVVQIDKEKTSDFFFINKPTYDFYVPDILALNLEGGKETYEPLIGEGVRVEVLGAIRYDYQWNQKIQNFSIRTLKREIKQGFSTDKFVILYLPVPFSPYGFESIEKKINDDVLKLVEKFPDIELWVKNHPRYPWLFDKKDILNEKRVKIYGNEVDVNVLLNYSSLLISPLTSVFLQAVLKEKPVIFYDVWKKNMDFSAKTIFDKSDCIITVSNDEELYSNCENIISGKKRQDGDIENFYRTNISLGVGFDESIVERYSRVVEGVLNNH